MPVTVTSIAFDSIDTALAEIKAGRAIVVVDDENRENEGDLICAAQFATPDLINFMAVQARGLICLAMTGERLDALELPLMVTKNTDSNQTAFTVSIDAAPHLGVKTGISAEDRAKTVQVAINPVTRPDDLTRPGHVFPIRAKAGGVLKRAGHTEAAVDLARLAGLYPAGVICEIQNPDGSMARLPQLFEYARQHNLRLISIADLIGYRLKHDRFVHRETVCNFPSQFGTFQLYAYRNLLDQTEHIAIVKGDPALFGDRPVMVRMHSECLTGDALGSLRCDCRQQLQAALKMIENNGLGVVVYLRQEGRGIGLINKLKAYSLQDMGLDTVEANERLGFPADLRDYGMGAQMLNDLGVRNIRLITNNPRKIAGLKGYGLEIVERVPLLIEANDYNSNYLATKAEKLGHLFLQTYLVTIALSWGENPPSISQRYHQLEKLRQLSRANQLSLQEETRPVANALFDRAPLIVHLGLDIRQGVSSNWYKNPSHPYLLVIDKILNDIKDWSEIERLEFLISDGDDSMTGLQMKLDRQKMSDEDFSQLPQLATQIIYSFTRDSAKS
ncbi:MAG: bifunctional 3,4-dihydroxy-2-butanone-4-phosphate synthase RibB/GTP cyclohydrolase II RibA [Microcystis aeruginosa K13-05]|uniref:bifunctional 3,4-dihydroxy-2-butanone-4-phosphate synthase/GTP cyclohydrolase II n=1 Tax=unclassified Microcystis TaxID=2643300 RepID=UPI0022C4B2EB|nr:MULTISPECIES: bifunctional 3,4-dihydroxy-2-butanone-4-phosphate synthase/GTP cyclohydrolase II [unclassified Microcystis]MCZ8049665.1 bifunctional 3,4-dihydroxy-2-butanone-4-phosphate synthase/GTP cyclohydrolase II [Microcystis sp. LE19-41.2A]MCZ8291110.1 bifunctional 3,4-dihydroxy-2-butanone-4-phosphate synthase/GTP cyclohydrolase II [Microcystis sp. LE19-59.1C]NCR81792.1 bifunctional 3,4-dihydroxy-2-butanone-4-phosphate synthase RibB/GTP cyclohydrolase II RibA [Microcystis aeruginosa K13-10